ncbi:exosortase A system-associated hydrolase 1 [Noviherbaspirillum humi]|uniref:Exosortase A system-associated hydrolase 1 n=1 Tax=Noviherbaspirillum humi TaxID=1688639 RepID=A0A239HKW7_9BURK|nr:hydrolase 1, exosortase A system-associated [Noviherbaspirillum humi]SNS81990.1 exosortase A system-associated hydrolase 1 [Noviherbaspirillum humi]
MSTYQENVVTFRCHDASLYGIVSRPVACSERGVLVIVGGPQYRVGAHRQFTLLARALATNGIPVMRFDYRGMGDSDGETQGFNDIQDDLRAAVDAFMQAVPAVREVVLWGLCDAASAACLHGPGDKRITGMILINPWVRTETSQARAYLKHYYLRRFVTGAFWRKVVTGKFGYRSALESLGANLAKVMERQPQKSKPLPELMYDGLARFGGRLLIITSGSDLTAQEFEDTVSASSAWQQLLDREGVERRRLPDADHTFSRQAWRDQVALWCQQWLAQR